MAWVTISKGLSLAMPKLRSFKPLDFPPESSCSVTDEAMGSGAQVPASPGGGQRRPDLARPRVQTGLHTAS